MKYLCLVYYRESEIDRLSHAEWDSLNGECMALGESITESGHRLGGEALEPTDTGTTVRIRNRKVSTRDDPFAETKEQLAGLYALEAKDLNEAIQVASRIPPARYGSVEVRPVRQLAEKNNSR